MGVPCDEILGNHSKGLPGRFYTLWAESRQYQLAGVAPQRSFVRGENPVNSVPSNR